MEEKNEDTAGNIPGSQSHSPFLNHLLQEAVSSTHNHGQDSFQPGWTPSTEETTFPIGYSGWSVYGPPVDFASALGSSEFVNTNPSQFAALEDYMSTLSQPDSESSEGSFLTPFGNVPGDGYQPWNEFSGRTYDPFGHSDVFHDMDSVVTGVRSEPQPAQEACEINAIKPEVTNDPTSLTSASKPSYSEVAKNKLSGGVSGTLPTVSKPSATAGYGQNKDHIKKYQEIPLESGGSVHHLPFVRSRPRSISGRQYNSRTSSETDSCPVHPDSKYGLDSFEELDTMSLGKGRTGKRGMSESSVKGGSGIIESIFQAKASSDNQSNSDSTHSSGSSRKKELPSDEKENKDVPSFSKKQGSTASKESAKRQEKDGDTKLFFDPKRIFQRKDSSSKTSGTTSSKSSGRSGGNLDHDTLLNNHDHGKHKVSNCAVNKGSSAHYINNDLRHSHKQTNMDGNNLNRQSEKSFPGNRESSADKNTNQNDQRQDSHKENIHHSRVKRKGDSQGNRKSTWQAEERHQPPKKVKRMNAGQHFLGEVFLQGWLWLKFGVVEIAHIIWNLLLLVSKVALLLGLLCLHYVVKYSLILWKFIKAKIPTFRKADPDTEDYYDWSNPSSQTKYKSPGLEENIPLPTTGEEAMKRLLACKGKDPYSILGLRSDASDDDIKKYYRRQAVLVHPDKNHQPGAEEAFKILGHAIEIIGEPEKRKKYDSQRTEAQETEAAMQQFADLLTKLHDKIQEAANTMRCDACGGKHRRVPVDRAWYAARFCDKCNIRHSAKEGDVWAESTMLGFLWHYYACMEGKIYDITEWARCQGNHFKHIQANAHQVIYRIATNASQHHHNHHQNRNNDSNLEDLINHLFNASRNEAGSAHHTQSSQPAWNTSGATGKKKRRKKRH